MTFTCVKGANDIDSINNFFRLPKEPVRPIDPVAWIEHCNALKDLHVSEGKFLQKIKTRFDLKFLKIFSYYMSFVAGIFAYLYLLVRKSLFFVLFIFERVKKKNYFFVYLTSN